MCSGMQKKIKVTAGWLMAVVLGVGCAGAIEDPTVANDTNVTVSTSALRAQKRRRPPNPSPAPAPNTVCAQADEGTPLTLTCPSGQVIGAITFASYGTPTGSCGAFQTSGCDAAGAAAFLAQACVGSSSCAVDADNDNFGDPCEGIYKHLDAQATCTTAATPAPAP